MQGWRLRRGGSHNDPVGHEVGLAVDGIILDFIKEIEPGPIDIDSCGNFYALGTQAAVEFVCQPNSLQELLHQPNVSSASDMKPFEAVIQVKVARGVPVGAELVALRKLGS